MATHGEWVHPDAFTLSRTRPHSFVLFYSEVDLDRTRLYMSRWSSQAKSPYTDESPCGGTMNRSTNANITEREIPNRYTPIFFPLYFPPNGNTDPRTTLRKCPFANPRSTLTKSNEANPSNKQPKSGCSKIELPPRESLASRGLLLLRSFLLFRSEAHSNAVHAVAKAGGLRPVWEDVPEVPVAVGTSDFSLRQQGCKHASGTEAMTMTERSVSVRDRSIGPVGVLLKTQEASKNTTTCRTLFQKKLKFGKPSVQQKIRRSEHVSVAVQRRTTRENCDI